MPARSLQQLKLVYAKRNQYKTKEKTPRRWKWVWKEEWGHLAEGSNQIITSFKDFKS